jgi:hypothetical protein
VDEVCTALRQSRGIMAAAALQLGCDRTTIWRFAEKHQKVRDALYEARQSMVDIAEGVLFQRVTAGDAWAVCFYLKTQAKDRGYVERVEQSGPDGGPIQGRVIHEIVGVNPDDI